MDKRDAQLLTMLQADSTIGLNNLAKAVNLSPTPCWRRLQKLRDDGVICREVVLCDPAKLNLDLVAFVTVRSNQHGDEWTKQFVEAVCAIPEIIEIYRMSGDVDYLLKVVVPNIAGYDKVYKRLIRSVELMDVSSAFAMEVIKRTTALPTDYIVTP
ncbi:MAG TPA: Lrp/AsnC family transcriptional regulator [Steroidobacteraceae bacterium]|uniref:Lrp/AsnC family transcriptional regulator n=1 Tax=Pseudomonas sp. R37(2017) TaxID=1981685 RepID=UPI000A1FC060|nr:Lrp/AsnC family transcriptional regulator [Pseudomonas sp. R37(2017)]HKQ80644.1 Lrp/AsnC family transcriptional regulator [Steroidobacteraceae bacterium]